MAIRKQSIWVSSSLLDWDLQRSDQRDSQCQWRWPRSNVFTGYKWRKELFSFVALTALEIWCLAMIGIVFLTLFAYAAILVQVTYSWKSLIFHLVFSWWWAEIRGTGWSSLACFCLLLLLPLFFLSSMLLWKYIKIKQTHNFVKLCGRVAHAMQCNDYMSGPRCLSYKPFKS